MRKRTRWEIRGYRSTHLIYQTNLPIGTLSEREMVCLLQRLACKHLSFEDIAASSMRRRSKRYSQALEPRIEASAERFVIEVGHNPYFVASAK
jgi:hypothetical protein